MDKTRLANGMTVEKFRKLVGDNERLVLAEFVVKRFDERYFVPLESTPTTLKHGFTTMAICCLVIETLESFYRGMQDTQGHSKKLFQQFFNRETALKVFSGGDDWFFKDIRCAILHQSETRSGWRILRSGSLLNKEEKTINATLFLRHLRSVVQSYAIELESDDVLWENFKVKMEKVCENCA